MQSSTTAPPPSARLSKHPSMCNGDQLMGECVLNHIIPEVAQASPHKLADPPSPWDVDPMREVTYSELIRKAVMANPNGLRPQDIVTWLQENYPQVIRDRGTTKFKASIHSTLTGEVKRRNAKLRRWRHEHTGYIYAPAFCSGSVANPLKSSAGPLSESEPSKTLSGGSNNTFAPLPTVSIQTNRTVPLVDHGVERGHMFDDCNLQSVSVPSLIEVSENIDCDPQASQDSVRSGSPVDSKRLFASSANAMLGTTASVPFGAATFFPVIDDPAGAADKGDRHIAHDGSLRTIDACSIDHEDGGTSESPSQQPVVQQSCRRGKNYERNVAYLHELIREHSQLEAQVHTSKARKVALELIHHAKKVKSQILGAVVRRKRVEAQRTGYVVQQCEAEQRRLINEVQRAMDMRLEYELEEARETSRTYKLLLGLEHDPEMDATILGIEALLQHREADLQRDEELTMLIQERTESSCSLPDVIEENCKVLFQDLEEAYAKRQHDKANIVLAKEQFDEAARQMAATKSIYEEFIKITD